MQSTAFEAREILKEDGDERGNIFGGVFRSALGSIVRL